MLLHKNRDRYRHWRYMYVTRFTMQTNSNSVTSVSDLQHVERVQLEIKFWSFCVKPTNLARQFHNLG